MSRYPETDTSFQAGDWLAGAARRNPEALLLLAAGACLLMRSSGSASSRSRPVVWLRLKTTLGHEIAHTHQDKQLRARYI